MGVGEALCLARYFLLDPTPPSPQPHFLNSFYIFWDQKIQKSGTQGPGRTHISEDPGPRVAQGGPGPGWTHINEDPGPGGTHISEDPRPRGTHISEDPGPRGTHISEDPGPRGT